MDIFFILIFQFVKYSMMLQWLYNHLFQAVQSMFQLIQVNRPMCNHPLQVTFLILELKFYSPRNCCLNLKKILQEFQALILTVLMPLTQNCTKC